MKQHKDLYKALSESARHLAPAIVRVRDSYIAPQAYSFDVDFAVANLKVDIQEFCLKNFPEISAEDVADIFDRLPNPLEDQRDVLVNILALLMVLVSNNLTDIFSDHESY